MRRHAARREERLTAGEGGDAAAAGIRRVGVVEREVGRLEVHLHARAADAERRREVQHPLRRRRQRDGGASVVREQPRGARRPVDDERDVEDVRRRHGIASFGGDGPQQHAPVVVLDEPEVSRLGVGVRDALLSCACASPAWSEWFGARWMMAEAATTNIAASRKLLRAGQLPFVDMLSA